MKMMEIMLILMATVLRMELMVKVSLPTIKGWIKDILEWVTTNKYIVNVTVTIVTLYISHLHLDGLVWVLGQKMQMAQEMQQMQVEESM